MIWHENQAKLSRDSPYLLNADGSPYDFTIDVGNGWKDLLSRTFKQIAEAYAKHGADFSEFYVAQIKEKFGELRIYLGAMEINIFEDVDNIVESAESESRTICEMCGEPGKPRSGIWIKTLCDKHALELDYKT